MQKCEKKVLKKIHIWERLRECSQLPVGINQHINTCLSIKNDIVLALDYETILIL